MESTMKRVFIIFLPILLIACFLPAAIQKSPSIPISSITPTPENPCAYVEGQKTLEDISKQLLDKLTSAALPVENARAEAYGENCIKADGSVARFSARETDFYVTLRVTDLTDESVLGDLLEQTLAVIDQFPPDQTPGPNPGYVGITFKAGERVQNLWFTQIQVDNLHKQELKGADLYRALKGKP
jgi:hypothetical protein